MPSLARALIAFLATWFCSRLSLQVEIVALRHQLPGADEKWGSVCSASNRFG
ncbi:hypothetical protein [Paraburkholderia ginsengiterrae]|uniref:hypothetical protein n=1 Tax=Paraburkholderia ginsengiterrae TaxID=1462993 RepID=UPI0013F4CCFA|nr:hypothetical protein [Paraburkholderia ginsengiterrae]